MKALLDRLSVLLRARYPLAGLLTHEEPRAARFVEKLATQEGLALYQWSSTDGLRGPQGRVKESREPLRALEAIEHLSEPTLFVFYDLHPFFSDPRVVRRLRDAARTVGPRRQAVLLVGPTLPVPPELEKELVVLDLPLPDRDELSRLLAVLLRAQNLSIPPDRFERFVKGSLGLSEDEAKRLFARILIGGRGFSEDDVGELVEEKRLAIRRSPYLEFWESTGIGAAVGGMDNLKRWLVQRRAGFTERARAFGLPEPKGVFLLGVQGCGKSLMAKAIADLWQLPLLRLETGAVFRSGGGGEMGLRETIRVAESLAPVVLWIDEIEKGFLDRGPGGGEAFGYFLTWMQEKKKPVFVVATANEARALPPELLRKGRFDEIFFVDLPNVHERLSVLEIQLRRRGRRPDDFDLPTLAEETERFSGAELEQLVVSALFAAWAQERELEAGDLLDAARETVPLAVTMDDKLKDLREWARPRCRSASADRRRVDFFEDWDQAS
jgi:hypothetical protein